MVNSSLFANNFQLQIKLFHWCMRSHVDKVAIQLASVDYTIYNQQLQLQPLLYRVCSYSLMWLTKFIPTIIIVIIQDMLIQSHTYMYTPTQCTQTDINIHVHIYTYTYMYTHTHTLTCSYVCVYVCVCMCPDEHGCTCSTCMCM